MTAIAAITSRSVKAALLHAIKGDLSKFFPLRQPSVPNNPAAWHPEKARNGPVPH